MAPRFKVLKRRSQLFWNSCWSKDWVQQITSFLPALENSYTPGTAFHQTNLLVNFFVFLLNIILCYVMLQLEKYSSAVLDCALDDGSPESSLVVAQILRKNKKLLFECSGKSFYAALTLLNNQCNLLVTEKCSANSYCAAMIALQMSSPCATEILLQLFPAMAGHTKSRAMDALALCFSCSSLNSEVSFKRI